MVVVVVVVMRDHGGGLGERSRKERFKAVKASRTGRPAGSGHDNMTGGYRVEARIERACAVNAYRR